jgi:hypothetical protein
MASMRGAGLATASQRYEISWLGNGNSDLIVRGPFVANSVRDQDLERIFPILPLLETRHIR